LYQRTGHRRGSDHDQFGLRLSASSSPHEVKPPRVGEVSIHFEGKLERVVEPGPDRHPQIVCIHVDPARVTGQYMDMKKLNPIGGLTGFRYASLGEIFERKVEDGEPR
jgi:hypothetical protein